MAVEEPDDIDLDDEDDFDIPCSFAYVRVCLLLPAVNGFLNAFLWPAYTLYFEEMGWPIVNAGLSITAGFGSRVIMQQIQLRAGYWLIVPLSVIHLVIVVLALVYQTSQWAVFLQLTVWLGIDPTCAIEGIAFDTFGASEIQARKATSTVLSMFTIAFACSCTFGGIMYDLFGWTGMAAYHITLQGLMTLLLAVEPACRHSFMDTFFPSKEDEGESLEDGEMTKNEPEFVKVVPAEPSVPGTVAEELDMKVEELDFPEGTKTQLQPNLKAVTQPAAAEAAEAADESTLEAEVKDENNGVGRGSQHTAMGRGSQQTAVGRGSQQTAVGRGSQHTAVGRGSQHTTATPKTSWSEPLQGSGVLHLVRRGEAAPGRRVIRASHATEGTHGTGASQKSTTSKDERTDSRLKRSQRRQSHLTLATARTGRTASSYASRGSARSALSALSRMSQLSETGRHFRHHFGAAQATLPQIVGPTGADGVLREELDVVDDQGNVIDSHTSAKKASIPKDIRLPAFFIVCNSFCNTCAYILEYATFAIFFKQVHNWNNATFAGMTQMAGDVLGAIAMQVIPALINDDPDPDEFGCFRRFLHYLLSKPYTLSVTLFTWIIFNLGMVSPALPLAITAQVLMGTTFVYSCKWSTDMNLFFSLGDSQVFLSLQVLCRNADAIGGSMAGALATYLFSLEPAAPFIFGTALAGVIFTIYTVGFCMRLGFGDDIETAEEKRARRMGLRRVSSWQSVRKSRVTVKSVKSES